MTPAARGDFLHSFSGQNGEQHRYLEHASRTMRTALREVEIYDCRLTAVLIAMVVVEEKTTHTNSTRSGRSRLMDSNGPFSGSLPKDSSDARY